MRAAIFNPYLDTLGGGERYTLFFASTLVKLGWQVDIEWKDKEILGSIENRFGIKPEGISIVESIERGSGYDLCFWVSDGSIPTLSARKNILHFQVPFAGVNGKSLLNKMKLFRINSIVCNSYFTKKAIDAEYGVNSIVIYPPVDVDSFRSRNKENVILFVGRFSGLLRSKGQKTLVAAFRKLYDGGIKDWKLILAGGVEIGEGGLINTLSKMAKGYPVEIVKSPKFDEIKKLYGKAKIFWSASGFGNDEVKNPSGVEHFGITVVEAMAAGAIPIVLNAGGHKEIVKDGINGFTFTKVSGLLGKTRKVIEAKGLYTKISAQAKIDSREFSNEKFEEKIKELI